MMGARNTLKFHSGASLSGWTSLYCTSTPQRSGSRPTLNMPMVPRPIGKDNYSPPSALQLIRIFGVMPMSCVAFIFQFMKYWMSM